MVDFAGSILNNIEEALIVTDAGGKILYFNQVAESLSNETLKSSLREGVSMTDIVSPERKEIVKALMMEIQTFKRPAKSFAEYRNKKGEILFLEFKYVPVLNEKRELTHIHTFFHDITSQKVFEKKLVTEVTNVRNLIDGANAIIIGIDTRGYITDWNIHCTQVTGYEKNDVYTRKFSDVLLPPEEREGFNDLVQHVLGRETFTNYELKVTTRYDTYLTFLLNTSIRTSPTGEIIGIVFVGQDVTELLEYRKSLEKQVDERTFALQQALAKEKEVVDMKSRFVAVASHEFRTPLSSIESAASFIKRNGTTISNSLLAQKLESIEKQITHMKSLLDDVLTFGKSEAGKIKLITTNFILNEFINKIVDEVEYSTRNTHKIIVSINREGFCIVTDEKLLRNILINLLTNAIKFSPGQPYVYLSILCSPEKLLFIVRDEGIGIPESECEKVFEPFERGKDAGSFHGTGLGLSIVKKAVELFKGTIELESTVNKGTEFRVEIPIIP